MISVCIATYNGEAFIKEQLESILVQLSADDEVIVSDDHSKDKTLEKIESIGDSRIRIVINDSKNTGVIGNFENAIKHSKGDFVFLSDQDDIWLDNKVRCMVAELQKGSTLVLSNCRIVDNDMITIQKSFFEFRRSKPGLLMNLYRNSFIGCCMAFKKELKHSILPFPRSIPMHDSWIGLSAYFQGNVSFIDDVLLNYRMHNNYSDTASGVSRYSLIEQARFRFILVINLLARQIGLIFKKLPH